MNPSSRKEEKIYAVIKETRHDACFRTTWKTYDTSIKIFGRIVRAHEFWREFDMSVR